MSLCSEGVLSPGPCVTVVNVCYLQGLVSLCSKGVLSPGHCVTV